MEVLLAYGANINVEGAGEPNSTRSSIGKNTPLMAAAYAGAAEAVGFLLKQHADWRLVDSDGKTALEVAFENQHQEVVATIEAFANDERTTYVSAPRNHTPVELTRARASTRTHTHTRTHHTHAVPRTTS
jgi:ankyrin repeat protein